MKHPARITDLQLDVLNVLWGQGEATVGEIHAMLVPVTGHARKTVGTLLHRLEKQGLVAHREQGREYVYRALVTREEVRTATVRGTLGQLFDGDLPALVSFALESGDVEPDDLARIRALIDAREGRAR